MKIPEEFLHFIWRFKLFNPLHFLSQNNQHIRVIEVGTMNENAGPDFLFAKIRIGDTEWVGHVEMHVRSIDWEKHGHAEDPAYNNVILHVVWEGESEALRWDGTRIPTLNIQPHVDPKLLSRYQHISRSLAWVPCENKMSQVPDMTKIQTLQRMLVERLEEKCRFIKELDHIYQGDWEHILFILLCRSFGMKVNTEAFVRLGKMVDMLLLRKYRDSPQKVEAILLGQAGLLPADPIEQGEEQLKNEYVYLKRLHHLEEMEGVTWRFMRMRPYNFPTFRIAQLSALYVTYPGLFGYLLEEKYVTDFKERLSLIKASSFWKTHFRFGKISPVHSARLTSAFVEHIIINAFAPVLFAYGKTVGHEGFQEKAIQWMEECAAENNATLRKFKEIGLQVVSAAESQAALHLKKNYCDRKHCLQCAIGLKLMKA